MAYVEKVLIVDDVSLMRSLLRGVMTSFGYENIADAGTGEDAIRMVEQDRYTIIFLDINMPGMSGLKALQAIREVDREAFVVMVSAHSSAENVKQAMDSGVDGFLVKPYSQKKVGDILEKYRSRKSVEREIGA